MGDDCLGRTLLPVRGFFLSSNESIRYRFVRGTKKTERLCRDFKDLHRVIIKYPMRNGCLMDEERQEKLYIDVVLPQKVGLTQEGDLHLQGGHEH